MSGRGLPLVAIVREAWLNLRGGVTRATALAAVFLLTGGTLAYAWLALTHSTAREALAFQSSGANILTLSAPGLVDGERCAALAGVAGVRGAGALRSADDVTIATLPEAPVPVFEATPGFAAVLGMRPSLSTGVWMSGPLADDLSARRGTRITIGAAKADVAAVFRYPDDGRDRMLAYALVSAVPATGSFDHCWVSVWPQNEEIARLLTGTLNASPGDQSKNVTKGSLNSTLGDTFDPRANASLRELIRLASVLFGLVLGAIAVRIRRLELINALHADVGKVAMTVQLVLETAVWLLAACAVGGIALWTLCSSEEAPTAVSVLLGSVRVLASGAVATIVGAALAVLSLRPKRLYVYFRSR